jgi:hypothetical protein
MPVTLTLLNGQGTSKIPYSPYEDGEFIFVNKSFKSLKEAFEFSKRNYTLSTQLQLREPIKIPRNKKSLNDYRAKEITNISLRFTEIEHKYIVDEIIDIFKSKGYAIIIGYANSYDGKKNFDLQCIIKTSLPSDEKVLKNALLHIQSDIQDRCRVDISSANIITVQPPSNNNEILYCFENGKVLKDSGYTNIISTKFNSNDISDFAESCLEIFSQLGFNVSNGKKVGDGIPFFRRTENGTKRGYLFYMDNPIYMYHKNPKDKVSIYHQIKNTKDGKEFIKSRTKEHQKRELIKTEDLKIYKKSEVINERYLDFKKHNKIKIVQEFLKSDRGVLRLKSAMGTAKSDGVQLCIEEAHKRGEKVIIVSNRISVAKDFLDKYGLILYQDPESLNNKQSLIVQYDSLHKYDISQYDVAIFDEYISLLLHHRSNLTTNSNINAIKFKLLSEKKRVLIADAFLTGYDLNFFKERDIFLINNEYKDDITLYDYNHKEKFIMNFVRASKELKTGEHMSASFTSLNMIKLAEYELRKAGVKVISLTSETAELTREIIYKKFKEESHDAFQVILFTPTLTVGVSNVNNVISHWHYDSSMGADVISSLQMIKRSRAAKEIHYFIQSRQNHFDTDIKSLNDNAQRNISRYYESKDKTLLVDMDYETGELKLTNLAKYINKIEVFYNILANNHANAFRLLLQYQFKNLPIIIEDSEPKYDIREKINNIKNHIRERNMKILDEYSEVEYTEEELNYIKHKISKKTPEEQAILMMGLIQEKFSKKLSKPKLKELTKLEIDSGQKFIQMIKNTKLVIQSDSDAYAKYLLSDAISSDIGSLQGKKHIGFLKDLLKFSGNILDTGYTKNDILRINSEVFEGKRRFQKFISNCGYIWNKQSKKYETNSKIYAFLDYI